VTVDEMDLVSQLRDVTPLRPEAYERARTTLRAAMAESGPLPEAAPVPEVAPVRRRGFSQARNRRRGTLGARGKVGIGAGIAAVAAGVAVALAATSAPQPAAPTASASQAPAVNSKLVSLAALITASSGPLPGDASLIIQNVTLGSQPPLVSYNLYTDSGAYYAGYTKQGLASAVAHHDNAFDATDARVEASELAAARYAATGDLAAARVQMAIATGNSLGLGLSPAARQKLWDESRAQANEILKEKGAKTKFPANPPTGKALQEDVDNMVWMNSIAALTEGGGSPQIRAGVLRLLSTISGVNVADSTTNGQPTLTLTAGPAVFGGTGKNVVVINAKTGMPVSSWSGDLPPSINGTPTPPSMTTYQVSRVTLANIEAGKF
jgi:hypothetical protein